MFKKIKSLLQGMGSVMAIAPATRASQFLPSGTDVERLRADFERIGADMRQVFAEQNVHGHQETLTQEATL